jgi:hypothetical protein
MSAAEKVLDRLQRVRQTRPDNYVAACPCCQSRNGRPIKVTETDAGAVLVHAFCGCATADVLGALGLTFSDLFDAPLSHHVEPKRRALVSYREACGLIDHEVFVVVLLINDARGRSFTQAEQSRLELASARISKARAMANA